MKKNEFLDILNQSLDGEIRPDKIKQNIDYYNQYIGNNPANEEEIIEELGDPRLIAKTIIETEKIAMEKAGFNRERDDYRSGYRDSDDNGYNQSDGDRDRSNYSGSFSFGKFKWYHKLILILLVILLFVIIIFLGRVVISFLLMFGVPILVILLLVSLFRRR